MEEKTVQPQAPAPLPSSSPGIAEQAGGRPYPAPHAAPQPTPPYLSPAGRAGGVEDVSLPLHIFALPVNPGAYWGGSKGGPGGTELPFIRGLSGPLFLFF